MSESSSATTDTRKPLSRRISEAAFIAGFALILIGACVPGFGNRFARNTNEETQLRVVAVGLMGLGALLAIGSGVVLVIIDWKKITSDQIAWTAMVLGALVMIGAAVSCIEEGGTGLVSWEYRRQAKMVIWCGAASAIAVPATILAW